VEGLTPCVVCKCYGSTSWLKHPDGLYCLHCARKQPWWIE
ncbi:unnamed protein product, partial [marine sediment metagenome]